jgi:hypothetical protein
MTVVRVKGFQIFDDRHGRRRCYHRRTRIAIDLVKYPIGSAEFLAECSRIAALVNATAPRPGTLGMLIEAYRGHAAFLDLAPRTRSDYQAVFNYLKPIADTPLIKFDKPLVVRIRDKAATDKGRKFANDVEARFSGLFGWGSERGFLAANTAAGIKDIRRRKDAPDANRPWADEERDAVLAACPAHIRPAIALMMFTGLGLARQSRWESVLPHVEMFLKDQSLPHQFCSRTEWRRRPVVELSNCATAGLLRGSVASLCLHR